MVAVLYSQRLVMTAQNEYVRKERYAEQECDAVNTSQLAEQKKEKESDSEMGGFPHVTFALSHLLVSAVLVVRSGTLNSGSYFGRLLQGLLCCKRNPLQYLYVGSSVRLSLPLTGALRASARITGLRLFAAFFTSRSPLNTQRSTQKKQIHDSSCAWQR